MCESKTETQHVEVFVPNVVEPSFGIDRILSAVYEHSFYARETKGEEPAPPADKKAKGKKAEDKITQGVLGFPAEMAPYKVVFLPLDMRLVKDHSAVYSSAIDTARKALSELGLQYKVSQLATNCPTALPSNRPAAWSPHRLATLPLSRYIDRFPTGPAFPAAL